MKPLFPALCLALAAFGLAPVVPARAQSGILLRTFNIKAGKLLLDPTRPRLYATLPQDNSIAVIDTNSNTVLTTFFIGSNPVDLSISPDATRLYVANSGSTSAAIGVVDLTSLTTLTGLPAPFAPAAVAAGADNRLYVLSSGYQPAGGIVQIDAATGVNQAQFGYGATYEGGFLQVSPDGNTLFFGDTGITPSTLASFDVSTATPGAMNEAKFDSTGSNGLELIVSHNGQFLVFPNASGSADSGGDDDVTPLISTSDVNDVLGIFNDSYSPGQATFSADDSLLYQSSGGFIQIFSTTTFALLDSFSLPLTDYGVTGLAVTSPNGYLYIATVDNDPESNTSSTGFLKLFSTQSAPFFDNSATLADGFYYLAFADNVPFGYYNFDYSPILYHLDLGFEYPFDAADGQGGIYLYDFTSSSFFFTSTSLFPYLYDFTLNAWLYYYPNPTQAGRYNTNGIRYFYDFNTNKVIKL